MSFIIIVWLIVALLVATAAEQTMIENAAEVGVRLPIFGRVFVCVLIGILWPFLLAWMIGAVIRELLE